MSTPPFNLHVPDMHSDHARHSISEALEPLGATLAFDMESRQIRVGNIAPETALAALAQIGFPASPAA